MKDRLIFGLKILLTIALMGGFFLTLDVKALLQCFSHFPWHIFFLGLLCMSTQLFFATSRWFFILQTYKKIPFLKVMEVNVFSTFLQNIFLGTLGASLLKVALIRKFKISLAVSMLTLIMDRLAILVTLLGMIAVTFFFFSNQISWIKEIVFYLGIGTVLCALIIPFLYQRYMKPRRISYIKYLRNRQKFYSSTAISIAFSVSSLFFYFLGVDLIASSMGLKVSLLQIFFIMPAITFISSLPISLNGWGVREGAMVFGFSFLGIAKEQAFALSISIGILSLFAVLPLICISLIMRHKAFFAIKRNDTKEI